MKKILCYLLIVLCFTECKKSASQASVDEGIIKNYISVNKLTATATGSGLYYVIKSQGTGKQPSSGSTVKVAYKGYLTNGSVFDQSATTGISFALAQVISGWQEGIPYFKKGGNGMLLIPSGLGYGSTAQAKIPANSVLIFDINLIDTN